MPPVRPPSQLSATRNAVDAGTFSILCYKLPPMASPSASHKNFFLPAFPCTQFNHTECPHTHFDNRGAVALVLVLALALALFLSSPPRPFSSACYIILPPRPSLSLLPSLSVHRLVIQSIFTLALAFHHFHSLLHRDCLDLLRFASPFHRSIDCLTFCGCVLCCWYCFIA